MRSLIVGDIHGCHAELVALMARAGLTADDELIAVGDLIDRGPAPGAVLELFRTRPRSVAVMGNHEVKHLRYARGEGRPGVSQLVTRCALGVGYAEAVAWMGALPACLRRDGLVVVHAGLAPGVALAAQDPATLIGLTALPDGWWRARSGEDAVAFGHRDHWRDGRPLVVAGSVYGLDTGCCFGGRLTGVWWPSGELVSVPSATDEWGAARRARPDVDWPWGTRPPTWAQAQVSDDARVGVLLAEAEAALGRLIAWAARAGEGADARARLIVGALGEGLERDGLRARLRRPHRALQVAELLVD